jgi:hypothetical protein
MKSKLTRMKPEELGNLKFKEAKMIVKKDLANLQKAGSEGATFFVITEFNYADKEGGPLLVVGDLKGEWKKFAKEQIKPPHKNTAVGSCFMNEDGTTLTLNLERGKAKPKMIEKALTKGALKIVPSTVTNVVFNETPKLASDEQIDATDELSSSDIKKDTKYKEVLAAANEYKGIEVDKTQKRLQKISEIDDLILEWEKENIPTGGDAEKDKRNATLQKLRGQLYSHRLNIQMENRPGPEPIDQLKKAWEDYNKRPKVTGVDALADIEDRNDTVRDLAEDILAWIARNPAPYSKKEKPVKAELDKILTAVNTEINRLAEELPKARVAHVKAMLDKITSASPEDKEKLKEDEMFMFELSRTVPTAQINDARKLLGLDPVPEERGGTAPSAGDQEVWDNPEIQEAFKDFAKFTTFEVAVDHRENPEIEKTIKLLSGTYIWEEGKTSADKFQIDSTYHFTLDSEDSDGNLKLKFDSDPPTYYYCAKASVGAETHYKTLDPSTKLFPETPSKNHVIQGGLGNCYLLAALTSLVNKDPKAIEDMMLDKGKTVTVRLFDVKVNATDGTKTFTAKYFNVDKSIVMSTENKDEYAKTYLWVQMLEKAYAAGGFSGTFNDYKNNLNAAGTYAGTEGGHISFSFEVLTGRAAELLAYIANSPKDFCTTGIPVNERGKVEGNDRLTGQSLPWGTDELTIVAAPGNTYNQTNSYSIFGNDMTKTVKWFQYVATGDIDKLFNREHSGGYDGQITIDDFEQLFQGKMKDANDDDVTALTVLDAGVAADMLKWIKDNKLYPGKRGSGIYSTLQLTMFKDIKDALDANKMVGLGSKTKVGRKTDGTGHSGGEAISGGLVGGHAYSVLNTREKDPIKELEIRNPWASTVQKNLTVADRMKELEKAMFALLKKEAQELKPTFDELKSKTKDAKAKYEAEKDEDQKELLKVEFEEWAQKYKTIKERMEAYINPDNVLKYNGLLPTHKGDYDKAFAEHTQLKKKDSTELISKELETSDEVGQEAGEFWLLLDDLTRRFSSVHIG